MFTVAFSGYRPNKLPFFGEDDPLFADLMNRVRAQVVRLINDGAENFISGMALGVDTYCAELVLELQKEYPDIKLSAAIPCADQTARWSKEQQARYNAILEKCSEKTVLAAHYYNGCMQMRNRFMVDNCDILIAVYDGKTGGTMNAVKYAADVKRKTIIIPPII